MELGGRAAFAVPAIAAIVAFAYGLLSAASAQPNAVFTGWDAFKIVFIYTFIIALPVGLFCAVPMVVFGELLPKPRWASLILVGTVISTAIGLVFTSGGGANSLAVALVFGTIGAACAGLWWLFVERHRFPPGEEWQ